MTEERGPQARPPWWPEDKPFPPRGGGFRPPWWPEGEAFPPQGHEAWRGMRRRFMVRVGIALLLFFALAVALGLVFQAMVFRGPDHPGPPFFAFRILWGIGLIALAVFLVRRLIRGTAAPVADVMEAADRVAAGDYSVRLDGRGSREMRRLARSFNAMTERLQANEVQRRNLFADVTHELRTPLTVMRGNVEAMLEGVYETDKTHLEPVLEETNVMARLLDDLQTLALAEAGALRLHIEPVDPGQLAADAVSAFRARARAADIELELRSSTDLPLIEVDAVRIGEVIANLLLNALRHTPAGGSVTVAVEARDDESSVEFSVTDTGPGIPPADLLQVFDRFVKTADSGGSGLGLSIAKRLVEAHNGTIDARNPPEGGTRMRFVLPTEHHPVAGEP